MSKNFVQKMFKHFKFGSIKEGSNEEDLEKIAQQEQKLFPFETLVAATKNFHITHKLGEGGFGPVFKGKLEDGREIAVKKLSHSSNQGKKEFMNKAKLLARVQHQNVVNLLGYCVHGVEKLLVYEYVTHESLDKLLFKSNRRVELDWKKRSDIIAGIAQGLFYLHEDSHNCIIHRDIKASNILLDDKWIPKIADFGMARLFPEDQIHVNTRMAGTNGYIAPEYAMHGHLSVKADVFSFGVLVLELISGQRNSSFNLNVDAQNLLDWTYKLYRKGRHMEIMDPTLASSAATEQVALCIQIGLLCTQGDPQLRPTMRRVVVMLSKKPGNLEEPTRPGVPGSRYRRSRRPPGLSSTGGTSGESDSRTFDLSYSTATATAAATTTASATATTTATATTSVAPELDRRGKRPMQKEKTEDEVASEPRGMVIDVKEVKITNSSGQKKFEIEEIGNKASSQLRQPEGRQPEGIQVEEMQLQASSTLKPQGVVFDDEAVEMTSNSSEQTEIDSEEIGNEASPRQPEIIQDEEMERATSTLEPQGEVFNVEALKMPRSSRQIEFQIKDNEMEHEADRPEEARLFLRQGGLGLTKPLKDEDWENAKVMNLMDNELSVLPENPRCPKLSALCLKRNYKLRIIPPSFFDYMPALQILNLSRTGIKSLPDSIIRLVNLKRLFLNDCHCFMMLSPKVGELKQLEVLDLEGTEIMDLPQEIKKLTNLTCLEVSFCEYMSDGKQAMQSNAVVPCGVISELSQLEELNIDVNPEDERWDAHLEDIVNEVCVLNRLETLKFYFPRVELLRQFLWNIPLLSHFRFTIGRHVKRIISRVPPDVEFELGRWERCLIYINGEDVPGDIKKVLQHVTAFFLDRHATVKKLSNFGIRNMVQLKCLVMGECNEVQVIIDEADVYEEDDISKIVSDSYATEKIVLGSLEYLYIYYMKSLRSVWEGSVQQNSLILLRSLTLGTCPQLTVIFSQGLLANLCNLEELKVKDCPSVISLVSCKNFSEDRTSYFLPNLKKISLHYMTGLDNISSGLHIAPKLEWLSFYDCPHLKNPFIDEISSQDLKKIKGERIWWEALKWSNGCPAYLDKIFVPIDDIWDC